MYYGNIKNCDIADGIGVRVSLFVSGCRNHCKGCFQPETWDFHYGKPYTKETEDKLIEMLKPSYIDGLTILGGDPMEPENRDELIPLLKRAKETYPEKTIWLYTGYTFDKVKNYPIMQYIDILVDGRFVEEKKNLSLAFRGSENQRIIDVQTTLKTGKLVLWEHPQPMGGKLK